MYQLQCSKDNKSWREGRRGGQGEGGKHGAYRATIGEEKVCAFKKLENILQDAFIFGKIEDRGKSPGVVSIRL